MTTAAKPYNGRWVTLSMLQKHTGKHRVTVFRALRNAGVEVFKFPGVQGGRIKEADANKFLSRQWPDVGLLPISRESKR